MKTNHFFKFLIGVSMAFWIAPATAQQSSPIAGCTQGSFVNGGVDNFIGTSGFSYTPKCLRIKAGSRVTIEATSRHPLMALPDIEGFENPLAQFGEAERDVSLQFFVPGIYGYFCSRHGDEEGNGMAGIIEVTE